MEEGLFHQSIDNLFAVKTIYQNYIGIVAEHFNIFRAIRLDNFKIFAFVRQFKQAARHGDDLRIDVNGGLLGIGQIAVYPTGKRAAKPIWVMCLGGVSANSSQPIMARLYDNTSSDG